MFAGKKNVVFDALQLKTYSKIMQDLPAVIPSDNDFGAKIENVDLSNSLSPHAIDLIKDALSNYGVITFSNQQLRPDDLVKIAYFWDSPVQNVFFPAMEGNNMVSEIIKRPEDKGILGSKWHCDHSYHQQPAHASILYSLIAPKAGDDTIFLNTIDGFSNLPNDLKNKLINKLAEHENSHVFGKSGRTGGSENFIGRVRNQDMAKDKATHPIVIKHPFNEKASLYVNPNFTTKIVDCDESISNQLLEDVYECMFETARQHTVKWQAGTLAIWDNLMTWHKGSNDFHGELRHMLRVAVNGQNLYPYDLEL